MAVRAADNFVNLRKESSSIENKIMIQAERLNALNLAVTSAMLVERFRMTKQASFDNWLSQFPNLITDAQSSLKKVLEVKDTSAVMSKLTFSNAGTLTSRFVMKILL